MDESGFPFQPAPGLDNRQHYGSMSRMGHRLRSNSMMNITDNRYPSTGRSRMASSRRPFSRGRQPRLDMPTTWSERALSTDLTRKETLHSRSHKRSATTDGDVICGRSSYGSGSRRSKTWPSVGPDGQDFERFEAVLAPIVLFTAGRLPRQDQAQMIALTCCPHRFMENQHWRINPGPQVRTRLRFPRGK